MADSLFSKLVPCAWQPDGEAKVLIPVSRITEGRRLRLIMRKRPYRTGAKLDSTGSDPIMWELESLFHNDHQEDGIPETLYPRQINAMCDTLVVESTGTLTLPTRGPVRAWFAEYRRVESDGLVDAAGATFTFVQDNEDKIEASTLTRPSAKAVARLLAKQATEAAAASGAWSPDISDLNELAGELEALANAPGDFIDDLEAKANAVANAVDRVEKAFVGAHNRAQGEHAALLSNPKASFPGRVLRRLSDTAKRVTADATGIGRTTTRTFETELSIFDIGTRIGQDGFSLMKLNRGIPDLLAIPARTPVRIFDL